MLSDGLRSLFHFFHNGSHGQSLALSILHESLKFISFNREKYRHIHIPCTPSFDLFNRVVGWIPLLSYWRIHLVLYLFHYGWNSSFLCCFYNIRSLVRRLYSCLTPQFWWHSSANCMSHCGICTTDHTKQKDVSMFYKDVSHRVCQKYVPIGFWSKTYKNMGIGECAGVSGNYSISKLKRCWI